MLRRIMRIKRYRRRTEFIIMRVPQINYGFRESVVSVRDLMIRMGYKTPVQVARGERLTTQTNIVRAMETQRVRGDQARVRVSDTIGRLVDAKG